MKNTNELWIVGFATLSLFLIKKDQSSKYATIECVANIQNIKGLRGGQFQEKLKTYQKQKISNKFRTLYHTVDYRDPTRLPFKKIKRFLSSNELFSVVKIYLDDTNNNILVESLIKNSQKNLLDSFGSFPSFIENKAQLSENLNLLRKIKEGELIQKSIGLRAGKLDSMPIVTGKNLSPEKFLVIKITEKFSLNLSFSLIASIIFGLIFILLCWALLKQYRQIEKAQEIIRKTDAQFKFSEYKAANCNSQRVLEVIESHKKITKLSKNIERLEQTNHLQSVKLKSLNEKIKRICDKKQFAGECPESLEKLKQGIKKNPKKLLKNLPEYTDFF